MVAKDTGSGVGLPRFMSQLHPHHLCDPAQVTRLPLPQFSYLSSGSELIHVNVKGLTWCLVCSECSVSGPASHHYLFHELEYGGVVILLL